MITIATSIMPRRIEAQQEAINSWLTIGFDVVSVNLPGEVDNLHAQFPGVSFFTTAAPASAQDGDSRVTLGHLMTLLSSTPGCICGIVNSDICFRAGDDFLTFIEKKAADGMIFGSRIDLDRDDHEVAKEYCLGFDYFFFDKKLVSLFPEAGFCLGMPYWDYFVPMVLLAHAVPVQRLISPVAYHRKHATVWRQDLDVFGNRYLDVIKYLFLDNPEATVLSSRLLQVLKNDNIGNCSEVTRYILRYAVKSLTYEQGVDFSVSVLINNDAFEDMKTTLLNYDRVMAANQRMMAAIYSSKSWRITKPLRTFNTMIKKMIR